MKRNPKFVLFRDRRGEYRWRLVARNGRTIAQSEGYARRRGATGGIAAAIACCADALVTGLDKLGTGKRRSVAVEFEDLTR